MEWNVESVVAALQKRGSKRNREGMARYGITAEDVLGVSVAHVRDLAKRIGRNHSLAVALWKTNIYEARMMVAFIAEPERVTPAQMDRWARDFDNWAICDGLCFHLFDRTPHAWTKVAKWSGDHRKFVRRAAFALLAGIALHDKTAGDEPFLEVLPLIERCADDDRNFVKKAVSWALRSIGARSHELHAAALEMARRLSQSEDRTARWIGKDGLRDLSRPLVLRRLKARAARRSSRQTTARRSCEKRRGTLL